MERDSVISHGMVDFLTESMMERGDKYKMAVCNTTGLIAIYNPAKNLFLSPMADGPLRFVGSLDGKDLNIDNVSQFGRSFSIVSVPYSLKLLIQELQTINVQMRLITEDNIDQMESMTFSNNIEKLSGLTNFNDFKNKIKTALNITNDYEPTTETPQPETTPMSILSSIFTPSTPDLSTPEFKTPQNASVASWSPSSPAYAPGTPPYQPTTPDFPPPKSPTYQPTTPDFPPPKSPTYQPTTPDFPPPVDLSTSPGYPPSPEYEEGEIVYYRGDKNNPPVPWNIEKVGKDIITITNSNGELEVVSKYDLYTELPPMPMKSIAGGMSMPPMPMPMQRENTQPMTGGIDFHPMIFIGGNADGIGSRILDGGSAETVQGQGQGQISDPIQVQESAPAPAPAPAAETSMFGGLLDFSKLVVKKQN